MRLALYDSEVGYYCRPQARVGYGAGTDFFTSSTTGPVFGELVAAAATSLLEGQAPGAFLFFEIGAEPGRELLASGSHPFKAARPIPLGTPIALRGPAVVFANELFDAQPFRRFVHRQGRWHELGVACREGALVEVTFAGHPAVDFLPPAAPEGYVVDAPLAAVDLLDQIAREPWHGVFIACDYGKTWAELKHYAPAGTARAYFRHTQSNDLLARPGEQDLTCHVCWDWLAEALRRQGFR
ncbi:MAG: SAM-dependent methyltransferase, partial [Opitutales bacterium]